MYNNQLSLIENSKISREERFLHFSSFTCLYDTWEYMKGI